MPKSLMFGILGAVVLLLIGAAALLGFSRRVSKPSPSPSATIRITRDTKLKALYQGYEKVSTDCYVLQVPSVPRTDVNKDCQLSVFYGPQKTSSVVVSAFREFDFVATEATPNQSNQKTQFDSKKILEGLITNATSGKAVSSRQDIKVGNLSAVKIVASAQTGGEPGVAYVFIVLPETDQQFREKTFTAFIVTGAYNDDFSRKGFDQAMSSWTWQ